MNRLLLAAIFAMCLFNFAHSLKHQSEDLEELFGKFTAWKTQHKKHYTSTEEEFYRFKVWTETKKFIEVNQPTTEHKMKLNKFSDLTQEEFKERYLMKYIPEVDLSVGQEAKFENHDAPTEVNWATQNKTPAVKNQGQCGSCWAFAAMCQLNSAIAIKSGTVGNYSEQQLVSCSASYGNGGCGGGVVLYGLKYVKERGVCSNSVYPYKSGESRDAGRCDSAKETKCKANSPKVDQLLFTPRGDCAALQKAIAQVPVSVALDASNFGNYDGGILKSCSSQLNHAVTAVGYKQGSHWLIENSWGADWGEDGFARIAWGNTCGICQQVHYSTVG